MGGVTMIGRGNSIVIARNFTMQNPFVIHHREPTIPEYRNGWATPPDEGRAGLIIITNRGITISVYHLARSASTAILRVC